MELSEVMRAEFAIPVVGVLVLAMLVFAFGFKSPVQPSSQVVEALIDDHEKRNKKSKTKKVKLTGHAEHTSKKTTTKQSSVGDTQKQPSPNKVDEMQNKQKEIKERREKVEAQSQKVTEKPVKIDEGEWTKAVSRKDRKARIRKEEHSKSDGTDAESTLSIQNNTTSVSGEGVKLTVVNDASTTLVTAAEAEIEPKKSSKKSSATSEQRKPTATKPSLSVSATEAGTGSSVEQQMKGEMKDVPTKTVPHAPGNKKNARMKKSREQPDDERGESSSSRDVVVTTSSQGSQNTAISSPAASTTTTTTTAAATKQTKTISVADKTAPRTASAEVKAEKSSPSKEEIKDTSSAAPAFDELGDWQDAKPIKRKKKLRRDD